ncbi:unnamed protein product [Durusdinium trenchii]|uniref:Uncharacterized protein n=1 Tax=Durusdinium trenchii TaxID=1381693 RepID=A0ABP0NTF7_9DINO
MVFSADAWSLLTVTVVAAFLASGDAGQGLTPRRAKAWLFLMSAVLVLSLLVSWALQSWLPPKYPAPPGPKEVADWPVCALFDDELQVNFYGEACIYCETQRQRCGKAWISWLRLPGSDRDHNLVQFLSLFLLSLLRRACNQRGESEVPSTGSGAAAACGSGGEGDDEGEAQKEKERAMWFHNCCAAAMWISLAGAALFQAQANLISVVYIVLLFHSIYTAGVAKTIRGRVRALQGVRTFNMLVMVIWAFYQCPSLPCGLLLDLAATGASGFLSPQQCAWLEKNPSSSSYGTGTMRAVSILLQSIGLQKVTSTVFFDWTNVLNIALFFSSSFLAVVCSRWDMQISQKIQEDAEELEQRSRFYVAHVKCWRKLELQQVATKHEILRQKLRDLIVHLNSLRAFWANMARPSDEEEEAKERKRAWQDFIQNLCLSSGAAPEQVIPELLSFAEAAGVAEQRSEVKDDRGDVLAVVDCLWTEHVPPDWANWVLLEGLDEKTAALLEDCILSVMRSKELQHLQRMSPEEVDGCEAELLRKCRAERLPPEESQDEPTSQNATSGAELLPQDEAHVVPAEGSSRPSLEELVKRTRPLVEAVIDDLLFCHVGIGGQLVDLTIEEHRKKDKSFFSLLGKALWSHAFELVALCAMLQFISYRSVLAFGSVFTVVISQMFFPHAELVNMAWALAARELREAPKMAWIAATVLPEVEFLQAHELSSLAWAYADLGLLHRPLLGALAACAREKDPKTLAAVLLAMNLLSCVSETLSVEADATPSSLANLMAALALLRAAVPQ